MSGGMGDCVTDDGVREAMSSDTGAGSTSGGAFGAAVLTARIRVSPEDFRVEELDGFEASGEA